MKSHAFLAVALMLSGTTLAQVPPSVSLKNFSERLTKDVPVSGRVLVGAAVMRTTTPQLADPILRLDGTSPAPSKDGVCVSFASRDGQYAAQGSVDSTALRGLATPVKLSVDRSREAKAFLAKLTPDELTALAEDGPCERRSVSNGLQRIIALDGDARESQPVSQLVFYVNSGGLPTTLRQLTPQISTVQCQAIEKGRRIAYDKICIASVSASQRSASLQIERTRYERALAPVTFQVTW